MIFNEVSVTVSCDCTAELLWQIIQICLASLFVEQNFMSCLCHSFTVLSDLTFRDSGFRGNIQHHVLRSGQAGNSGWNSGRNKTTFSFPGRSDLLFSWNKGTFPKD